MLTQEQEKYVSDLIKDLPEGIVFGDRLREIQYELKFSQRDFGSKIKHQDISYIYKGGATNLRRVYTFAVILDRTPLVIYNSKNKNLSELASDNAVDFMIDIGKLIEGNRKNQEISARRLCQFTKVTLPTYEALKQGVPVRTSSLEKICRPLELVPIYLI